MKEKHTKRRKREGKRPFFISQWPFFDQKIDEKRTMLPNFFHNDYDCPQINQMLETKNKKKKNELFWLIILSTTLSDFGDNFGIERWNEKKKYTTTTLRYFEWKKNNTYEHYALKNNDGFFLYYYYYYTYTMLSSKKNEMQCAFSIFVKSSEF